MSNNSVVSVLMSVYNPAFYIKEDIESTLNQTFVNFELLIFNGGSQDMSSEIIKSIQDERTRFFDDGKNTGYVKRLNDDLKIVRGKYIARVVVLVLT